MKSFPFASSGLFACLLAIGALPLRADEGHDHSKHDHNHASEPGKAAPMSTHDAMTALYQHMGEMEKEVAAGNLDGIHGHDEAIQAAVKDLDKDTTLTEAKKKRVQGYVKNTIKLSGKLHADADGKMVEQARKDLEKLKAQVDLLDKQFSHSHKPGSEAKAKPEGAHHH